MDHASVLRQLIPLAPGGDFDALVAAQGDALDALNALIDQLLAEVSPETAAETLGEWEVMVGATTDETEPAEKRRARIVAKLVAVGGINTQYYIDLAAAMGHAIEIESYFPFVTGHGVCGDVLCVPDIQWQVTIRGISQSGYAFRCGESRCGESLGYNAEALDVILDALKPAHVKFVYEYEY